MSYPPFRRREEHEAFSPLSGEGSNTRRSPPLSGDGRNTRVSPPLSGDGRNTRVSPPFACEGGRGGCTPFNEGGVGQQQKKEARLRGRANTFLFRARSWRPVEPVPGSRSDSTFRCGSRSLLTACPVWLTPVGPGHPAGPSAALRCLGLHCDDELPSKILSLVADGQCKTDGI